MSEELQVQDKAHMQRALELAARGLFTTDPNPRVGCVVANAERVLGEGWHAREPMLTPRRQRADHADRSGHADGQCLPALLATGISLA